MNRGIGEPWKRFKRGSLWISALSHIFTPHLVFCRSTAWAEKNSHPHHGSTIHDSAALVGTYQSPLELLKETYR